MLRNSYISRGDGCGFYSALILVESKALKQAHSKLHNFFSATQLSAKIGGQKTATVAVRSIYATNNKLRGRQ